MAWELPYKVLNINRVFLRNIKWYGNPRYILLSRFQIWCYEVDTFPNLAVLPKMVSKSWWWKSQSYPLDGLTCTTCEILRRIWISRSRALSLPVYPAITKMVWEYQDGVRWLSLVQIASWLVFQGDFESEEGNFYVSKLKKCEPEQLKIDTWVLRALP